MEHSREKEEEMLKRIIGVSVLLIAISLILATTQAMAAPSRVFVTSTTYTGGGFGGLSGADNVCNQLAAGASLGGTYTAWLSDDTTSAADRVYHNPEGYITTNGDMVANSWADLINADFPHPPGADLLHTINYDENGVDVGTVQPWSGTFENGQSSVNNCENWSTSVNDFRGDTGLTNDVNEYWSEYTAEGCDLAMPLYCFENQPPPPAPIPVMNEWGMIILSVILAALSLYVMRRRIRTS